MRLGSLEGRTRCRNYARPLRIEDWRSRSGNSKCGHGGSKPSLGVTGAVVVLSNSKAIRCNRITHTRAYSGKQGTETESMW